MMHTPNKSEETKFIGNPAWSRFNIVDNDEYRHKTIGDSISVESDNIRLPELNKGISYFSGPLSQYSNKRYDKNTANELAKQSIYYDRAAKGWRMKFADEKVDDNVRQKAFGGNLNLDPDGIMSIGPASSDTTSVGNNNAQTKSVQAPMQSTQAPAQSVQAPIQPVQPTIQPAQTTTQNTAGVKSRWTLNGNQMQPGRCELS